MSAVSCAGPFTFGSGDDLKNNSNGYIRKQELGSIKKQLPMKQRNTMRYSINWRRRVSNCSAEMLGGTNIIMFKKG